MGSGVLRGIAKMNPHSRLDSPADEISVHPLAGQFGKLTQWDQVVAFFTFLSQQLGRVQQSVAQQMLIEACAPFRPQTQLNRR
jgi:hypothetical protein